MSAIRYSISGLPKNIIDKLNSIDSKIRSGAITSERHAYLMEELTKKVSQEEYELIRALSGYVSPSRGKR